MKSQSEIRDDQTLQDGRPTPMHRIGITIQFPVSKSYNTRSRKKLNGQKKSPGTRPGD
jgi:hypothetical protein